MSLLGEAIRQSREARGLTLKAAAQNIGMSISGLQRVEWGQVIPRVRTIRAIARYFEWTDEEVGIVVLDLANGRESRGAGLELVEKAIRALDAAARRSVGSRREGAAAGVLGGSGAPSAAVDPSRSAA